MGSASFTLAPARVRGGIGSVGFQTGRGAGNPIKNSPYKPKPQRTIEPNKNEYKSK
jgi:hypothetical protein